MSNREDHWHDRWMGIHARENKLLEKIQEPPVAGRIEVVPCEFGWYWHAYVGDLRVNGGLCETSSQNAHGDAKMAISAYRSSKVNYARRAFMKEHYWDEEARQWIKHGELPLPPV